MKKQKKLLMIICLTIFGQILVSNINASDINASDITVYVKNESSYPIWVDASDKMGLNVRSGWLEPGIRKTLVDQVNYQKQSDRILHAKIYYSKAKSFNAPYYTLAMYYTLA